MSWQQQPRQAVDGRGLIAFLIAIVAAVAMVLVVPGLAPGWLLNAIGRAPHRLAPAVVVPDTGSYSFLQHQDGAPNDPVAWNPCRPIHYEVNPAGGPPDAMRLAEQAIERAQQVTGLVFQNDGETDARPRWHSPVMPILGADKPVLISWATAGEVPELSGNVAGIGGSVPRRNHNGWLRYTTGGVTLDADSFATLARRPNGEAQQRAIILHELGHVLGLDHVPDAAELMYADNVGLLDYGRGDLAGLAKLGSGRCA
jgi:hypothetical protein